MGDVFRSTYKKPLPDGVQIHKEKASDGRWRRYIRVKTRNGREVRAYLTEDGSGYLHPQKNWAGYYVDYQGKRRKVNLCTDKGASQAALAELSKAMELLRAG